MSTLDLGIIGNGTLTGLIDRHGDIVWMCVPRVDGDPAFCSLLQGAGRGNGNAVYSIALIGCARSEQEYVRNTPILLTRLFDAAGGAVEITDFVPRFRQFGRIFCPMMLVRMVRPLAGSPRVRVRLTPSVEYGRALRSRTYGSHHIRYIDGDPVLRLTTDASITNVLEELPFVLDRPITLVLGPDETLTASVAAVGREFLEETTLYWQEWVRSLAIPYEWQDDVIRAAITLQLNAVEDTGAIVAAVTTSIPESAGSARNWDYRFCWLRDAFMVVGALNRLGATRTMERYISYIVNIAASSEHGRLQPVYAVNGHAALDEREVPWLPGYRGMGPVRVGNLAYTQVQHDAYGSVILAAAQLFFDRRLVTAGTESLFERLEVIGLRAAELYDQPDAGIWEFRGRVEPHTFSAVMCWAACDRLARIGFRLGIDDRAAVWRQRADSMHAAIVQRTWNPDTGSFAATLDGKRVDASLLLLHEVGFVDGADPRFAGTVRHIEHALKRGDFVFRYVEEDGFGEPSNAFLVCTFWYINALVALGRRREARDLFTRVLSRRNSHGLMAEHIDPVTFEQWGNYVQTYSMVGQIMCAIRLSESWDTAF